MKRIVITGGPCSGKTTVIEGLAKRGFPILKETAKEIVAARRHIPISKEESQIRQDLIFNKQLAKEERAGKKNYKILFLDRCLIDGLAYSLLYSGRDSIKKYLPFIKNRKYDSIFIFEGLPFSSEDFRAENDEKEAKRIRKAIYDFYKEQGYKPINVPAMPVERRLEFILKKLKLD
jgi:predicted ATPase